MSVEQFFNAKSIEEVVNLLDQYKDDAKIIAGGTDLVIALNNKKISPKVLIDISKLEELRKIEEIDGNIVIGAAVSFTHLMEYIKGDNNLKGLYDAARSVGSPQIRNKATLGGNIGHSSPAADSTPPLIALGAKIKLMSKNGTRIVLLEDYSAKKNDSGLRVDELIHSIEFPKLKKNEFLTFTKLGLRKALAISRITTSAVIELDENKSIISCVICSGSIGRYPMREKDVEHYLIGKVLNENNIEQAVEVLKDSMDLRLEGRTSLSYKRIAIESILKETLYSRLKLSSEVSSK